MKSGNFSHVFSSTLRKKSEHIEWDFGSNSNGTSFYIDGDFRRGISEKNDGKRKMLWGLESRFFNGSFHLHIKDNLGEILEVFDTIFTYDHELLGLHPKFKWVPAMGTWIDSPSERKKEKLASMISSNKSFTPQHIFRLNYARQHSARMDIFGGSGVYLEKKEHGLDPYMFSVAVENDTCDIYFTEKILDCFATCTVPIYKGTQRIGEFFNSDGIIFIQDEEFPEISPDVYFSKLNAVKENLDLVKKFNTIEDWMYHNYRDILK